MKIYPVGSISIIINVANEQNIIIDDILLRKIEFTFENYLKNQFELYDIDVDFSIEINWQRGCINETVTLFIILADSYKFINDYDKIRNNLLLIFNDLKGLFLKIKGKKKLTLESSSLSEKEIKIIRELPANHRKYYESGKGIIFFKSEVVSIHKIAIMREDLKKEISEKDFINVINDTATNK